MYGAEIDRVRNQLARLAEEWELSKVQTASERIEVMSWRRRVMAAS